MQNKKKNYFNNYRVFTQKLEEYINQNTLFQTENFKQISGVKIAFSGYRLIENLFNVSNITPLLGLNKSHLFSVFKNFKEKLNVLDIRPLIVFEGIQCSKYQQNYKTQLNLYHTNVWNNIANGKFDTAKQMICESWTYTFPINELFRVFDDLKIEFMVGPYNHLAQISWMLKYDYVNGVYCELDALMYCNIKQMIYSIDLDTMDFQFIERTKVCNLFQASKENLQDLFILGGYLTNKMILQQDQNTKISNDEYFNIVCKVFTEENENVSKGNTYQIKKRIPQVKYQTLFTDTKNIIEQWLAFNSSCALAFHTGKPNKNHPKFCGDKLPPTAYFFLVFNLFSPKLTGEYFYKRPFADSLTYRQIILEDSYNNYKQLLTILVPVIRKQLKDYKKSKFLISKYFSNDKNKEIIVGKINPNKNNIFMNKEYIQILLQKIKQPRPQQSQQSQQNQQQQQKLNQKKGVFIGNLNFCNILRSFNETIKEMNKEKKSQEISNEEQQNPKQQRKSFNMTDSSFEKFNQDDLQPREIYANILLAFLHYKQYINLKTKDIKYFGIAIRKIKDDFEEYLIILLELLRPGALTSVYVNPESHADYKTDFVVEAAFIEKMPRLYSSVTSIYKKLNKDQEEMIRMISRYYSLTLNNLFRTFCLLSCSQCGEWPDIYDYDLSQFVIIAREVQNQQRYLFESILLTLHLQGKCENLNIYNSLKEKIPFRKNFNVRLGIVVKDILQGDGSPIKVEDLAQKYGGFIHLSQDLQRGQQLWEQLNQVVQLQINYNKEYDELAMLKFKNATEFLQQKFEALVYSK